MVGFGVGVVGVEGFDVCSPGFRVVATKATSPLTIPDFRCPCVPPPHPTPHPPLPPQHAPRPPPPGGNMVGYVTKQRETREQRGGLCLGEDECNYFFRWGGGGRGGLGGVCVPG